MENIRSHPRRPDHRRPGGRGHDEHRHRPVPAARRPLFAALVRALPVGLLLLAISRRLPRVIWWWRAIVLGVCNIGLFFPLIFLAAYHLPGGLAATVQAASPLAVMALAAGIGTSGRARSGSARPWSAWSVSRSSCSSPRARSTLSAWSGVRLGARLRARLRAGQALAGPGGHADAGVLAVGRRWPGAAAGRAARRGPAAGRRRPPSASSGSAWSAPSSPTSAVPWAARMAAGAVSLVGLVNPVVGTVLGVVFAGELFGWPQALGMALVLAGVLAGQPGVHMRLTAARAAALSAPWSRIGQVRTTGTDSFRLRIALAAYGPTVVSSVGYGAVIPVLALRARDLGAGDRPGRLRRRAARHRPAADQPPPPAPWSPDRERRMLLGAWGGRRRRDAARGHCPQRRPAGGRGAGERRRPGRVSCWPARAT